MLLKAELGVVSTRSRPQESNITHYAIFSALTLSAVPSSAISYQLFIIPSCSRVLTTCECRKIHLCENIAWIVHNYAKCEQIIDKHSDTKMWGQIFSLENVFCDKYCTSDYMIWDQPCESTERSKNENFQGTSTKPPPRLELGQKDFVMRDTTKDTDSPDLQQN